MSPERLDEGALGEDVVCCLVGQAAQLTTRVVEDVLADKSRPAVNPVLSE